MTGKKDDACGHDSDSAVGDELAPMRKWEPGMPGTGSYTTGPSHLDRADFTEGEEPEGKDAEPKSEAESAKPDEDEPPA